MRTNGRQTMGSGRMCTINNYRHQGSTAKLKHRARKIADQLVAVNAYATTFGRCRQDLTVYRL